MIPQAHVDFMWGTVINPRLGCDYDWGGSFDPDDTRVGTDCSGAVSAVIEALVHGPQMVWERQFWTGAFAGVGPGQPALYGMVGIAGPDSAPPDAACIVAIRQVPDPTDAHMICQVQGVNIEMGGPHNNLATGAAAADIHDREFNQWLILPGPIGNPAPPPLTRADSYALTIIETGRRLGITPRGIQIALATGLVETNLTIYANSNDLDSLNYPHDAVGSDHMSAGIFQQQDQGWGPLSCRMDVACSARTFFERLERLPYNDDRHTPGWYAQQVQVSAYPDRYDERWGEAVDLYTRLVNQSAPGDDMAAVPQQQWDDLYRKITEPVQSQSPFRALGEGPIWEPCQFWGNDDGFAHPEYVEWSAARGNQISLAVLHNLAEADMASHPDRVADIQLARTVLARVTNGDPPPPTPTPTPTPDPAPTPAPIPTPGTPGSITVKTTTMVHSIITVLGGGLAVGTWAIHSFGDTWSPGVTTAISSGLVAITGLMDFLVKESKDLPQ